MCFCRGNNGQVWCSDKCICGVTREVDGNSWVGGETEQISSKTLHGTCSNSLTCEKRKSATEGWGSTTRYTATVLEECRNYY